MGAFDTKSKGDDVTSADWNELAAALGGGNPAQGASYTLFYDSNDSEFKARNGQDGTIGYNGTNELTVLQDVANALTSGGLIRLHRIEIDIGSNTLTFPYSNTIIDGEGWGSYFHLDNANSQIVVGDASNVRENIILKNLYFTGNAVATNPMIKFLNVKECGCINCKLNYYPLGYGIRFDAGSGGGHGNFLLNTRLTAMKYALHLTSSDTYSVRNLNVFGGRIHNLAANGVGVWSEQGSAVTGHDNINFYGTSFHDNTKDVDLDWGQLFRFYGTRHETSTTAFDLGTVQNCRLDQCSLASDITTMVTPEPWPTGTVINNCYNYKTYASGSATIANGTSSIVVTHGLGQSGTGLTPTSIRCFGTHTEVDLLYADTIGATQFTIHASDGNTSGDRTVYYVAEVTA